MLTKKHCITLHRIEALVNAAAICEQASMTCTNQTLPPELGIIEGYFGRSWTWEDRAAVVRLLAPAGYRYFHYAPKLETKLRKRWMVPFDRHELDQIAAFADHCRGLGMAFGVGLTPYELHLDFSDENRAKLSAKVKQLNDVGIVDLAILFDDMRGDFPDLAEKQAEIIAFVSDQTSASRIFMCPSYYSDDPVLDRVFGPRPFDYLGSLGRLLDPAIPVYWTGEEVCSREYSLGHLSDVAGALGRKVALWDNYPVNDGPRMSRHLHLRGFTGRPADAGNFVSHHAINPACQPILGCIPALTLPWVYERKSDYRYGAALIEAATQICGSELAARLQADMLSLHDAGLDRLGDRRDSLKARYAVYDHPAAREVVDWLSEGYAITGEMLETQ
jgi:hyaluronoglucosaminidase